MGAKLLARLVVGAYVVGDGAAGKLDIEARTGGEWKARESRDPAGSGRAPKLEVVREDPWARRRLGWLAGVAPRAGDSAGEKDRGVVLCCRTVSRGRASSLNMTHRVVCPEVLHDRLALPAHIPRSTPHETLKVDLPIRADSASTGAPRRLLEPLEVAERLGVLLLDAI